MVFHAPPKEPGFIVEGKYVLLCSAQEGRTKPFSSKAYYYLIKPIILLYITTMSRLLLYVSPCRGKEKVGSVGRALQNTVHGKGGRGLSYRRYLFVTAEAQGTR